MSIQTVINHERIGIARYARSDRMLAGLWEELVESSAPDAPALRDAHARALVDTRVARLLSYRVVEASEEDQLSPADPNLARIASTLLDQDVAELAMEVLGADAFESSRRRAARRAASRAPSGTRGIDDLVGHDRDPADARFPLT